jgi:DNA-binding NtrC family response regulator
VSRPETESPRALAVIALGHLDQGWASGPAAPRLRSVFGRRTEEYARLVARIERAIGTPLPALIEGEAGSEAQALVALTIHQTGAQRGGPFVRVRGFLPPTRWGPIFKTARGGSILVSELHALSREAQIALLEHLGDDPRFLATCAGALAPELERRLAVLRIAVAERPQDPISALDPADAHAPLEAIERRAIADRLRALDWQQQRVAASLGIDRKTLYRKIKRYGLAPP